MNTRQARMLYKKHGSIKAAAKVACMRDSLFGKLLKGLVAEAACGKPRDREKPRACDVKVDIKGDDVKLRGKNLAEFRQLYDKGVIIPGKIKAGLKQLGNSWLYEVDFAKAIGVSLYDLGKFRDEFADHVVSIKDSRRAWAGTVGMAKAMTEALS